jgi:hypothetical protein
LGVEGRDRVRVVEGYLYVYPYAGDDIFVHPRKVDSKDFRKLSELHREVWLGEEGVDLMDILEDFEGRRVRVVVEPNRIMVEVLE